MDRLKEENPWVYVVVQDPGGDEQFLGQHDEAEDVSFIPAFMEKEEALQYLSILAKKDDKKYEVQAIAYRELAPRVAEHGFKIFILNGKGDILERT
ncbi:MAG: hypothetical protein U5R49_17905 [Deltaproteobacteria bacterium]|nr:hypothetical protein [Deltaproteobacteria bacterium]